MLRVETEVYKSAKIYAIKNGIKMLDVASNALSHYIKNDIANSATGLKNLIGDNVTIIKPKKDDIATLSDEPVDISLPDKNDLEIDDVLGTDF